jgi:Family of unknown function (DUF6152)
MRKTALVSAVAALGLLGASPVGVVAHHAPAAQFNIYKSIEFVGTLVRVDWINPHSWFYFKRFNEETGKEEIWAMENGGTAALRRNGIADKRLWVPGTEYYVEGYPDWTGATKAFATGFTFPDGKRMRIGFTEDEAPGLSGNTIVKPTN